MAILIKGMQMPENCINCPLSHLYYLPHNYLNASLYETPTLVCMGAGKELKIGLYREEFCPLIEVPPHGRLIDADAMLEGLDKRLHPVAMYANKMPTIIEAEGE